MRILFDTNALLWMLDDDPRFGPAARREVLAAESLVFSVASLWEISIKVSLKKLDVVPDLYEVLESGDPQRLNMADRHLQRLTDLPLLHKDPFDRLLIAQAQVEGLTVLTSGQHFSRYEVATMDVNR